MVLIGWLDSIDLPDISRPGNKLNILMNLPSAGTAVRSSLVLFILTFAGAGCGSRDSADPIATSHSKQELLEVGEMYRLATATTKQAPKSIKDCQGSQAISPTGFQAVKDGSIVVCWSTVLNDTSEEGSTDSADEVLAYEKAVPEQGGQVLMKNRTVKTMTADEFKAAPRVGK